MPAVLRVVLGVDNASKWILPTGIPDSVEVLNEKIRRNFALSGNFMNWHQKLIDKIQSLSFKCWVWWCDSWSGILEQGTVTGFYQWKKSLKSKMANYHTLRNIGCINSVKRGATSQRPNQVKKSRKAEVTYILITQQMKLKKTLNRKDKHSYYRWRRRRGANQL